MCLCAAPGVLFLGGHPTKLMANAVEELLTWYPCVPVEKAMQARSAPPPLQLPCMSLQSLWAFAGS